MLAGTFFSFRGSNVFFSVFLDYAFFISLQFSIMKLCLLLQTWRHICNNCKKLQFRALSYPTQDLHKDAETDLLSEIVQRKALLAVTWDNVPSDCAPNEDSNQPARKRSLIRVSFVRMKKLCILGLSKMRPVKIQIRLRNCAVWSESSLGAHIRWYVFWRCGSYLN